MRGKRAKMLRKLVYGDDPAKYTNNREYSLTKCPGQYRHQLELTILADDKRYLYQVLKGRRYKIEEHHIS